MKKLFNDIKNIKKTTLIQNSFLLPILAVVVMSISHVVSWYDLGNPVAWAIYLSVAIEIFALASVSAASLRMKKRSIWFLFALVTAIQIIGNVFFTYKDIDVAGTLFLTWVELIEPFFEDFSIIDHRRLLAYIQGGTLPVMSLVALHFYIKFNDNLREDKENSNIYEGDGTISEETVSEMPGPENSVTKEYVDSQQKTELSEKDSEILLNELENPKEPNEELKKATEEIKKKV